VRDPQPPKGSQLEANKKAMNIQTETCSPDASSERAELTKMFIGLHLFLI